MMMVQVMAFSMSCDNVQTLEKRSWYGRGLVKHDGFWCPEKQLQPILSTQKHFKAKDTDLILPTMPKSGTTWLKALTFSITNRDVHPIDQSPLLTCNPHKVVPFFEYNVYLDEENPNLETISDPRIFATHIPFGSLPNSIRESGCRIIYICRNPLDQFISHRHFWLETKIGDGPVLAIELEEAFDAFCRGIHPYGAFCDHVLGYWNAHLNNPEKVLFLKYEDLKEDIYHYVKKIADFIELPFSPEEEEGGLVEGIVKLCSFENLRNLDVNKNGNYRGQSKNSIFFRKEEVGDWTNYLTPAMVERFENVMEKKFKGSGLMFKMS